MTKMIVDNICLSNFKYKSTKEIFIEDRRVFYFSQNSSLVVTPLPNQRLKCICCIIYSFGGKASSKRTYPCQRHSEFSELYSNLFGHIEFLDLHVYPIFQILIFIVRNTNYAIFHGDPKLMEIYHQALK